jgi:hypothetical protein
VNGWADASEKIDTSKRVNKFVNVIKCIIGAALRYRFGFRINCDVVLYLDKRSETDALVTHVEA